MSGSRPTVVLVHGAANSAVVWRFWREHLEAAGYPTRAPDLRGHGANPFDGLDHTPMADYVDDVRGATAALPAPPVVAGWSMGGLVALMYAVRFPVAGVIALGPSLPGPLLETPSREPLVPGVYGPEAYGITHRGTRDQPTMFDLDTEETSLALASLGLESAMARQDRKRGIALDPRSIGGRALVIAGERDETIPPAAGRRLARFLGGEYLEFEGASHWGLVLNRGALTGGMPAILRWLDALSGASAIR